MNTRTPLLLSAALALATGSLSAQTVSPDLMRRYRLATEAIALNPPKQAILNSGLTASPMFAQTYARVNEARINDQAATLMTQTFTTEEIAALLAFQKSAEGRSIQMKMPSYQKMLGALIQNEFAAAFQGMVAAQAGSGGASGLPAQGVPAPAAPVAPTMPAVAPAGLSGAGTPR